VIFKSGLSIQSHYKVYKNAIGGKIVVVKTFSSDARKTATWKLIRYVPVESSGFERRQRGKLGY